MNRTDIKAAGIYIEIDDMAEGERYTSCYILIGRSDIENGVLAIKKSEQIPWVRIQVCNRTYLFRNAIFGPIERYDDLYYKVSVGCEDLKSISDWKAVDDRLLAEE